MSPSLPRTQFPRNKVGMIPASCSQGHRQAKDLTPGKQNSSYLRESLIHGPPPLAKNKQTEKTRVSRSENLRIKGPFSRNGHAPCPQRQLIAQLAPSTLHKQLASHWLLRRIPDRPPRWTTCKRTPKVQLRKVPKRAPFQLASAQLVPLEKKKNQRGSTSRHELPPDIQSLRSQCRKEPRAPPCPSALESKRENDSHVL